MKSRISCIPFSVLTTMLFVNNNTFAAELLLHQSPLYLSTAEKANVLVILDNSNSMDEAANGSAVGSANALSKSEIARSAVKSLITNYSGKINMGLMAYQQTGVDIFNLNNSAYDMSFSPANYDPTFTGSIDSSTKRYRQEKTDDLEKYIYYNVALPYYYQGAPALTEYCYSDTVVGLTGTPVGYHCYEHKAGSSDAQAVVAGYSGFLMDATFTTTDSDTAQGISSFGTLLASAYVGSTWFSNTSPGRGFLHTPITELDATQATQLNIKLSTSQFITNGPTDPTKALQNAGLTPLEGTLLSAKDYFTHTTLPADEGGPVAAVPESCGKDFIMLLTDGLPSTDAAGNETTDPATALADVVTAAAALTAESVDTYVIGFALPFGVSPSVLDTIAVAGDTSTAYLANNLATLNNSLSTIFEDILDKSGASASAASNSTSLSTNSHVYQARFNSGDWSGQLFSKAISLQGAISNTVVWDAANQLNSITATGRTILTFGRDTKDGIPFRWSAINGLTDTTAKDLLNTNPLTATADVLGEDRLNFIRGGTGGSSSSVFRTDRLGKLGDIVNSTPIYVGGPGAGYNDVEMSGYSSFFSSYSSRTAILYSGANDGMLHGFNASTGVEVLAYIPREVFPNLSKLTALGYGTNTLPHHYFVDGSPMVADANVSGWKTILAGGLNAGGQGIYALDITDPSTFAESAAGNIVLWEFTDEDDVDLGYTFIKPTTNFLTHQSAQIAKMNNGKWAVIIGNGYNNTEADGHVSTTGHAYLYVLFIDEGTDGVWTLGSDYIKIDTGEGTTTTPNGLATPTPIDTDGDGDIDSIYAGDLLGNMWKFDVSDSASASWDLAFSGSPLFIAKDSSNNIQAITSAPLVTGHPNGGYMVGFGTGQYMEMNDVSTTATQTFYGIRDNNASVPNLARAGLIAQTILGTRTIGTNIYRMSSLNAVDYTSDKGWYMDLPESGERIDVNPVIRDGRFVFVTRTPSTATCTAGGSSWLMEVDYLTGGRINYSPFDVNNDGVFDGNDLVTYTDPNGDPDIQVTVTGRSNADDGMISSPAILTTESPEEEYKIVTDSTGHIKSILESADTGYKGRISWEEIR